MLHPDMTEKDATELLTGWLGDRGVHDQLHKPSTWFGNRTAFQGFSGPTHMTGFSLVFFSSSRRLKEDTSVIPDVVSVRDGVIADVGYATCLSENAILEQLRNDLMTHRELIARLIRERRSMTDVAHAMDQLCIKQSVESCHKAYPFKMPAHRVARLDNPSKPCFVARSGLNAMRSLVLDQVRSGKQEDWSPPQSINRRSGHAPVPGLWAVEPRLSFCGVGTKFGELLVITKDDAYWLDDGLPHARRWQQRQLAQQRAV